MSTDTHPSPQFDNDLLVKLMQFLALPTFVLDAQGKVMIWNSACEQLTGVSGRDVIGTRDHWKAFYDTPRPCLADVIFDGNCNTLDTLYAEHERIEGTKAALHAENWCVMPQKGIQCYLSIDAGPIYDDQGRLLAVVETLRDISLQKIQQKKLEELASLDGLTGIPNRRSLDLHWDLLWKDASSRSTPTSVLLLDVDHFKLYNDSMGHQNGDACLRQVVNIAQAQLHRPVDVIGRYGGEEFMVILPHTTAEGARIVAERIRQSVESAAIAHPQAPLQKVTVSIGLFQGTPGPTQSPGDWVKHADEAMYQSKHHGRNRVTLYGTASHAGVPRPMAVETEQAPRVLVVAEDHVNRLVAVAMVKRLGCACKEAVSPTAAMGVLATDARFDIVLLDLSMSDISTSTMRTLIRLRADLAHTKLVAYTAHAMVDKLSQLRDDGFDDVLVKPVTMEAMQKCLCNNTLWPAGIAPYLPNEESEVTAGLA